VTDDESFNFTIPRQPDRKPVSAEEAERSLLEKLEKVGPDDETILQELAFFYFITDREQTAKTYFDRLIANTDDPEKHAGYYVNMGVNMVKRQNFEAGIYFYSQAYSLEPENTTTWCLINNNLGFCLNQVGRFAEAEGYCRSAIKIDPERHNAYKNLGVSLAGQGQYAQGARNYIKALRENAADPRALKLLEQLFAEHPEIESEIPDIEAQIQRCQEAVKAVAEYCKKSSGAQ